MERENCKKNKFLSGLLMNTTFEDPNYPADITEEVRNRLCDIHPSMIIGSGSFELFMVSYSYTTKRGNDRTAEKFIFIPQGELPDDDSEKSDIVRKKTERFFSNYNEKNPWRAITNLRIKEILPYANAELA